MCAVFTTVAFITEAGTIYAHAFVITVIRTCKFTAIAPCKSCIANALSIDATPPVAAASRTTLLAAVIS